MRHRRKKSHNVRNAIIAIIVLMVIISAVVAYQMNSGKPADTESNTVLLVTSMGNITIELYGDMPITTANFKNLTKIGAYDGTIFHRVVPGFVIQGGDVTSKGITVPTIQDELPNKHSNLAGYVAMAKASNPDGSVAANSATSQFFINLKDTNPAVLDSNYSVFGKVVAGMDVVVAISKVPIYPANDGKPLTNVTLIKAEFIS
ncbi:MAG: peptidylprolyl isomerase [Candidatus Bathyarchaeia archaeon]|jgi:peptidylprolyl isomerase